VDLVHFHAGFGQIPGGFLGDDFTNPTRVVVVTSPPSSLEPGTRRAARVDRTCVVPGVGIDIHIIGAVPAGTHAANAAVPGTCGATSMDPAWVLPPSSGEKLWVGAHTRLIRCRLLLKCRRRSTTQVRTRRVVRLRCSGGGKRDHGHSYQAGHGRVWRGLPR